MWSFSDTIGKVIEISKGATENQLILKVDPSIDLKIFLNLTSIKLLGGKNKQPLNLLDLFLENTEKLFIDEITEAKGREEILLTLPEKCRSNKAFLYRVAGRTVGKTFPIRK